MFNKKDCENLLSLLDSALGRIRAMLLMFPGGGIDIKPEDILDYFGEIMRKINGEVVFYVLGNFYENKDIEQFRDGVKRLKDEGRLYAQSSKSGTCNFHVIHLEQDHETNGNGVSKSSTMWAQDPFAVLGGGDEIQALLSTYNHGKPRNLNISNMVASQIEFLIRPTPYELEGGDVLGGSSYALIGRNTLVKNLEARGFSYGEMEKLDPEKFQTQSEKKVAEKRKRLYENAKKTIHEDFLRMLGKKYLYWIGLNEKLEFKKIKFPKNNGWQPLFHLDLFLNLGALGPDRRQNVYIAEIDSLEPPFVIGEPASWDEIERLKLALDEICSQFEYINTDTGGGPKFKVNRIPLILDFEAKGDPGKCTVLSYNNAIVEIDGGVQRIFLPSYNNEDQPIKGPKEFQGPDRWAEIAYQSKYHIEFIDGNFRKHSKSNGSLHCMTKVLVRT